MHDKCIMDKVFLGASMELHLCDFIGCCFQRQSFLKGNKITSLRYLQVVLRLICIIFISVATGIQFISFVMTVISDEKEIDRDWRWRFFYICCFKLRMYQI